MIPAIVGIPIKPFGVAKARLAPVLDAGARSRIGKAVASHTIRSVVAAGASPFVLTADLGVARWARRHGWQTLAEPSGGGLDGAAAATAAAAGEGRWAVLHADLPLLSAADLVAAWQRPGVVLAPAHDGGTSLVVATGPFPFRYGPRSFHRHLHAVPNATVVVRPGLALDLDTPRDLEMALALPQGAWLRTLVDREKPGPIVPA